ncbi:hypothetical protein WICPIJ_010153 [Wickerhamomyces pijperi]|uniref:Vacuolar-sorting protein SNF7 n=1 Tax=Wickerhamomyces pijperi TaxID=599730 RepID=A0A9P8TAY4_WICPI|nr:hypothetical protein WICPIJ_010153 [Wickerhamomyces pijperi]
MSQLRQAVTSHPLFTPTRLYSLYSDFKKLKEINPDGYEANLIAWRSLLIELFQNGLLSNSFILDTRTLEQDLTLSNYGKPLGLCFVLEELIAEGELIPLESFMSSDGIYLTKWVKPALNWIVSRYIYDTKYKMSDRKGDLKEEKLVSLKMLEGVKGFIQEKLDQLTSKDHGASDRLLTKSQFKEQLIASDKFKGPLTDIDVDVLLKYLERDTNQLTVSNDIIKLGGNQEEISETDLQILEIRSTILRLLESNSVLEAKIQTTKNKLHQLIAQPKYNKHLALSLLKSQKLAETTLSHQINSLTQLEGLLYKINESQTNVEVFQSIRASTKILSSLRSQIGDVETIEAVMDELRDESTKVDETTDALSGLNKDHAEIDDDEIEEEFERLLREETTKKKEENEKDTETDVKDSTMQDEIMERFSKLKLSPSEIETSGTEIEKKAHKQQEPMLN